MKILSRHVLRGASYLFDLSGEKSKRLRAGLMDKYSSRGPNADVDLLNRDAKKLNGDMLLLP